MSVDFEKLKEKILFTALDIVIFDGWSDKTLLEAALINGINAKKVKDLFPKGAKGLVKFYHLYEDNIFLKIFREIDLSNLSHSKKIELALFKRFEVIIKNKEAFRRSMAF